MAWGLHTAAWGWRTEAWGLRGVGCVGPATQILLLLLVSGRLLLSKTHTSQPTRWLAGVSRKIPRSNSTRPKSNVTTSINLKPSSY